MAKGKTLEERTISRRGKQEATLIKLKKKAAILFRMAYEGKLSIERLYEKGLKLEEEVTQVCPNFWDNENYPELKDSFEYIDELHDSSTRKHLSGHKEQIYYHMRQLSS